MPPPPEFRDATRNIGVFEILFELEAQHPPQAHRHIGIARKIEINLEGEGQNAQPGSQQGERGGIRLTVCLPESADVVSQQHFFGQAADEGLYAGGKLLRRFPPALQLAVHILIFDDRSGNQLGEQRDKSAKGGDILLRAGVAPVHVDGIGHGLKGIEGDANGQAEP